MIKAIVVDDDTDLLEMITLMLQSNEIQVTSCVNRLKKPA